MAKDTRKNSNDDNVQRVAIVPDPAADADAVGPALTEGQRAGLDPLDPDLDEEQAHERNELTNRQTDHERENALDPVSRGPSPGVYENTPLTAKQTGSPVTDMSGRMALTAEDEKLLPVVRDALRQAKRDDKDKDPEQRGWRTPLEMGVSGAAVKRMMENGAPLEAATVPNGHFFPETGTRYRIK